jgi:signal transduction histidine kinase
MLDRLEASFAEQRRFVADASHEMRTPITIVRGHLEVMRVAGALDPEQEETLDLAIDELHRMGNVLQDLLSLARIEGGAPPPFGALDLGEVVEEAVIRGQDLAPRRFSFNHAGPLPVWGNRDLLLQALLNLVSNAVGHTQDGGRISVNCRADAQKASVEVMDDGPGIPQDDLERVFDRFYRSVGRPRSAALGGTGLGLAIARRLVELHGGRLRVRNSPAGGAVFELELPLVGG